MRKTVSLESTIFSTVFIRRAAILLALCVLVLMLLNVLFVILFPVPYQAVRFQLNLDEEGNLTTWFNSTLFLFVSMTALTLAWLCSARQSSATKQWIDIGGWVFTGLVFLYLAVDDAAQIHDLLAWPLYRLFRNTSIPGFSDAGVHTWIPVYFTLGLISIAALFLFFRRNIWKFRSTSLLVLLGLFCFLLNPIVETLGNKRIDLLPEKFPSPSVGQQLFEFNHQAWVELKVLITIEESAEMFGAIFFLLAFLEFGRRLMTTPPDLDLQHDNGLNTKAAT